MIDLRLDENLDLGDYHDDMAIDLAIRFVARRQKELTTGLHPAYNGDVSEAVLEMFMDLPWDREGHRKACKHIHDNPEYMEIIKKWDEKFGGNIITSFDDLSYMDGEVA